MGLRVTWESRSERNKRKSGEEERERWNQKARELGIHEPEGLNLTALLGNIKARLQDDNVDI